MDGLLSKVRREEPAGSCHLPRPPRPSAISSWLQFDVSVLEAEKKHLHKPIQTLSPKEVCPGPYYPAMAGFHPSTLRPPPAIWPGLKAKR